MKEYMTPQMEVIYFSGEDALIVCNSGNINDGEEIETPLDR